MVKSKRRGEVEIPRNEILVGHVTDKLRELPAQSVQCVVTSPPYWGLRDYSTVKQVWTNGQEPCRAGCHEWFDAGRVAQWVNTSVPAASNFCVKCGAWRGELGLEPTPGLFVEHVVAVFAEVWRVLRDDGTLWLNIGDTYAGSNNGSNDCRDAGASISANPGKYQGQKPGLPAGLKAKDMVGVPWRVAFALQAAGWYLRNDIIWYKPNPMPESVKDRCTRTHEHIFLLTKKPRYFYDVDALREPVAASTVAQYQRYWDGNEERGYIGGKQNNMGKFMHDEDAKERAIARGRNKRDVWEMSTYSYHGAHFATFPPKLPRLCISAGTSERGACPECGAAWQRISEPSASYAATKAQMSGKYHPNPADEMVVGAASGWNSQERPRCNAEYLTVGWKPVCECGHSETVPCVVLDPFFGSGTTGKVAYEMGRDYIGIELNFDYAKLARERIGNQIRLF